MSGDGVVLEVQGLRKRWPDGRVVLNGIDLTVAKADVLVLLGPNGSGKSTFLRCLNRLEDYQEGRVLLRGEEVSRGVPPGHVPDRREQAALARLRQRVGPLHVLRRPRPEAEAIARAALAQVGLEDRAGCAPAALSGGQQQRVAIARALAMGPELILFDEPTAALDPLLVREVLQVIRELAFGGRTLLLVTHDLDFAREVADRILLMEAGRIVLAGPPDAVFASDHPLARRFAGA